MKTKSNEPETSAVPAHDQGAVPTGLFLRGTVVSRQRRTFPNPSGQVRYNIILNINTEDQVYHPERWTDLPLPPDLPAVGELVTIPVQMQIFQGKNGTGARLAWGPSNRDENI